MIKNLAAGGGSSRMLLFAALILGLLAAILVGVYLSNLNSDNGTNTSTAGGTEVPVVVAAQDIPALTVVTEQMLVVKNIPLDVAVAGAFAKTADVVGQTAQVNVAVGEQVLPAKVTSVTTAQSQFGVSTPLSLVIPQGMRAISVLIGQVSSAGGLVRPGDHIDLIDPKSVSANTDDGSQVNIGSACYVLQDVKVLTVGTVLASPNASTDANILAAAPVDTLAKLIVVAVNPSDAALVAAAQQTPGDASVEQPLWASLRPFGEHGAVAGVAVCGNVQPDQPAAS
jgi:pilus assembly protein CpaB